MVTKMRRTSIRQGFLVKLFVFGLMLSIAACNLPVSNSSGTGSNVNLPPTEPPGMAETQIAMGIQSTMSAGQQMTAAAIIQNNNQQAEQNNQPETKPQEQPTYTPYPTYTPEPAQPTATPEPSATS